MNPMQNKTPEERKAIAAKAHATRRVRREAEEAARQDALAYAGGLRQQIAELEARLAAVPPEPTFEGEKMQTTFEKLTAVEGSVACLTCGCGARSDLSMERTIAVGFGSAGYSRDGVQLWDEGTTEEGEEKFPTVADVEALAKDDPYHDWRIFFFAPLDESEYQRQGDGVWVLVRKGMGFA